MGSDSNFSTIADAVGERGLSLRGTGNLEPGSATHAIGHSASLLDLPELVFLPAMNPLLSLHCLAQADLLITGRGTSNFAKAAHILARGVRMRAGKEKPTNWSRQITVQTVA